MSVTPSHAALIEQQLEDVITEYEHAVRGAQHYDASDRLTEVQVHDLSTRCLAAIERGSGSGSMYMRQVEHLRTTGGQNEFDRLPGYVGIGKSLLSDLRHGFNQSLEELIHGDIFGDFLEMARHLADNGYKDAAAVIAGSTLEAHLRHLCSKHGLTVDDAKGKAKKADTLNSELAKATAYSKGDQKNVTAWLDLRNSAAHGQYSDYSAEQVVLLIASVRDFLSRNPA